MRKPHFITAWSLLLAMVLSLSSVFAAVGGFEDVSSDSRYADAVALLQQAEIVYGDGLGSYRPEDTVSYAELATMLGRISKINANEYSDETLVQDGWSAGYVAWLQSSADDGADYTQYQPLSYAELSSILAAYCSANGLYITGSSDAEGNATRGEAAALLAGVYQELQSGATVRTTAYGAVQGSVNAETGVYTWLGVPYGSAERWAAPTAPQAWSETLNCTTAGDVAIQLSSDTAIGSEDCLNLDIYAPQDAQELPVIVYVHGGNNQTGQSGEIAGTTLATSAECVYVSLNYRLGALGFNCLPALNTGDPLEDSGNYALLDIAQALDWVKENIAAFGGDGENITISGFSAGGRDVMAMLISPIFEGKFQRAITYSGGMTIADQADSIKVYANAFAPLAVEDGVQESVEAAYEWLQTSDSAVRTWLESLDAERIVPLMGNASIRMAAFPHLFNDGYVLPENGFDGASYADVPVMMITGTNEFSFFCMGAAYTGTAYQDETWFTEFNWASQYGSALYELANGEESALTMTASDYTNNIYLLTIDYGNDMADEGMMGIVGAFHGVFVPLIDRENQNYASIVGGAYDTAAAAQMSEALCSYLASFIRTGNPNSGKNAVNWSTWQASGENTLFFGTATEQADIAMADRHISYDQVIADIEADEVLSAERRDFIISEVLNSRWFSAKLDEHFASPSLWIA